MGRRKIKIKNAILVHSMSWEELETVAECFLSEFGSGGWRGVQGII